MSIPDFGSAAQLALPSVAQPASLGSGISTAVSAGRSMSSEVARFSPVGLVMRFKVTLSNYGDLGHWTSCDGLKVDFKYDAVKAGGEYSSTHVLPQNVVFGPVTLKRAVEAIYTDRVRAWLMTMYLLWNTEVGEFKSESTATIEQFFDVYQLNPVARWILEGVFPVSWSGPQMNAKTNEVATETLVLEHNGFLTSLP